MNGSFFGYLFNGCLLISLMASVAALLFLAFSQMKALGIDVPHFSLKPLIIKDVPVHIVKFKTLEDPDQIGILFKSGDVYDTCNKKMD